MHVERLLKLAALLEANANNPTGVKFDLDTWAKDSLLPDRWEADDQYLYTGDEIIPIDCGTTACAVGLAAISGTFADEGLTYEISNGQLQPAFQGETSFRATQLFFDIDRAECEQLFISEEYPSSQRKGREGELAVAERIRSFCNGTWTVVDNDDEDFDDDED